VGPEPVRTIFNSIVTVKDLNVARFGKSPLSPWRETRGADGLRFDRKAAIFLITGEILLHFSSTFILMGAPRLMTSGRLSLLCADT
jgi:hypothetical protein